MMCPMGSPKGVALMLISLGVGYIVAAKASKEQGFLKQLGYWIGSIIIILSVLSALCGLYGKMGGKPHFMHKGGIGSCPMTMPAK